MIGRKWLVWGWGEMRTNMAGMGWERGEAMRLWGGNGESFGAGWGWREKVIPVSLSTRDPILLKTRPSRGDNCH